jgi:hypothetical protein
MVPATATVTEARPATARTYPEYDRLFADNALDVATFFGAMGNGGGSDPGFAAVRDLEAQLVNAGFSKGTATAGLRYTRAREGLTVNVDVYGPSDFAGVGDYAHAALFHGAFSGHEVVVVNFASILGATDFWANARLFGTAGRYQVIVANAAFDPSHSSRPILEGKGSAADVDFVSAYDPVEVSTQAAPTATLLGLLLARKSSWPSILEQMHASGGGVYGITGARDNAYQPR